MNHRKPTAQDRKALDTTVAAAPLEEEKAEQTKPATVNLLVLGVYNTLVTTYGNRDDLLSPVVVDLVSQHKGTENEFNAFFLCTRRGFILNESIQNAWKKKADQTNAYGKSYSTDTIQEHIKINQISANFTVATGLKCLMISSAEDALPGQRPGVGYQKVIRPGEVSYPLRNATPASDAHINYDQLNQGGDYKNQQLLEIAEIAVRKYPKANIKITFADDSITTCNIAAKTYGKLNEQELSSIKVAATPAVLPANVSMDVFQHLATLKKKPSLVSIPKDKKADNVSSFPRPTSPLQVHSVFAASARPTTGGLTLPAQADVHVDRKRNVR